MKKIYKSKVDNWFIFIAVLPVVICLIFGFSQNDLKSVLVSIVISIIVFAFFIYSYFSTVYAINNDRLLIKSSFYLYYSIEIQSIKKISKSNSWEKAPAYSMDRLEIKYNEKPAVRYNFYDSVIISPENKAEFIQELQKINPNIEIEI